MPESQNINFYFRKQGFDPDIMTDFNAESEFNDFFPNVDAAIIGSLPFLVSGVLSVAAPDYLMLLFTETTGNYMLMGGGVWMFMGVMVMRNMINFKM